MTPNPTVVARTNHHSESAPVSGGQAVWEVLARLGVTHVFGYPGGAILPTYDALPEARVRPRARAPRAVGRPHG